MFSGDHLDQEPGTGYSKTITQGMTKFCFLGVCDGNLPSLFEPCAFLAVPGLSSCSNSSINRGDCVLNSMTCMVYYILLDPDQS